MTINVTNPVRTSLWLSFKIKVRHNCAAEYSKVDRLQKPKTIRLKPLGNINKNASAMKLLVMIQRTRLIKEAPVGS